MITEQANSDELVFKLAGVLAGDWAVEFERCWREATNRSSALRVSVDLTEVTYVDHTGKELLGLMLKDGVTLVARDILMKSIVEEIANENSTA